MAMNPVDEKPTTEFSEALKAEGRDLTSRESAEPLVADADCYTLALSNGGVHGWLGENSLGWAVLVTDPTRALILERYPYKGVTYYRIKGSKRYMSVSSRAYVGFYNWLGATGFNVQGTHLVSDHNGQKLSLYSEENGYVYAWDKYNVLDVKFEPIVKPVIPDQPLTANIEHVVVVMFENRSFDNVLGGLYPEATKKGLYRGLKGDESNPVDPNDPGKGRVSVFQEPGFMIMPYPDPGELFDDMNEQIFETAHPDKNSVANMQGFAWNYGKQESAPLHKDGPPVKPVPHNIMHYYSGNDLPMSWFLAKQFAVCDGWFASGPVQTLANRMFTHCGTPGLIPGTNKSRINNPDFLTGWSKHPPFNPPVHDKTIFELLDDAYPGEINWKVYYHDAPISALCSYVYDHWKWDSWDGGNVFQFKEHLSSETNFEYDIKNNRLPKYSFIEPRYTDTLGGTVNSNHPGGAGIDFKDPNGSSLPPPISVTDGEHFLKQVYDILTRYPETFKKTLLIVIYDEHGGLYDHVPPPQAVSPFEQEVDNFDYKRYGVRIPAVLINPYIQPGTIYPQRDEADKLTFDHTSLISTITAQFGLKSILTPRSKAAPMLKKLIPLNAQEHSRPAPPELSVAEARVEAAEPTPQLDVTAAMEVIRAQKNPHALAEALTPLLELAQQARNNQSG